MVRWLRWQDSKFEPWRSETEHGTSRSRSLRTILTFIREWRRNIFVSFKLPRPGSEPRTLAWKAAVLTTVQVTENLCDQYGGQFSCFVDAKRCIAAPCKLNHINPLSAKHANAIARATSRATSTATSRRFFKHTISSLAQNISASTCAIDNAIFF